MRSKGTQFQWGMYGVDGDEMYELHDYAPTSKGQRPVLHGSVTTRYQSGSDNSNRFYYAPEGGAPLADATKSTVVDEGEGRVRFAQQQFFGGGKINPPEIQVHSAEFTEQGSKRFGEAMGMIKNRADAAGADIVAASSLSDHSGPLVNRLADAGLVRRSSHRPWSPEQSNGITYMEPQHDTPWGEPIDPDTVEAGRNTVRSVARDMNAKRRASKDTGPRPIPGDQKLPF